MSIINTFYFRLGKKGRQTKNLSLALKWFPQQWSNVVNFSWCGREKLNFWLITVFYLHDTYKWILKTKTKTTFSFKDVSWKWNYKLEMLKKMCFNFFIVTHIFVSNSSQENCYSTKLLSACVLWCKSSGLPVDFERQAERCCCKLNDDVNKHYKVIQGNISNHSCDSTFRVVVENIYCQISR